MTLCEPSLSLDSVFMESTVKKMAPTDPLRHLLVWITSLLIQLNGFIQLLLRKLRMRKKALGDPFSDIESIISRSRASRRKITIRKRKRFWIKPGRTDLWWLHMINGLSLAEDWKKNFRMSKDNFLKLVDELRPFISPDPNSTEASTQNKKKKQIKKNSAQFKEKWQTRKKHNTNKKNCRANLQVTKQKLIMTTQIKKAQRNKKKHNTTPKRLSPSNL